MRETAKDRDDTPAFAEAAPVVPGTENEPYSLGRLLRLIAFRGLLATIVLTLLFLWIVFMVDGARRPQELVVAAESGFILGLFSGSLVTVEHVARRFRASHARDLAASLATGFLAFAAFLLATTQAAYAYGLLDTGTLAGGFRELASLVEELRHSRGLLHAFVIAAAPFAPLAFVRLRGLSLPRQVAATFAGGGVLGLASFAVVVEEGNAPVTPWFISSSAIFYLLLPVVAASADALERRAAAAFDAERPLQS